MTSRRNSLNRCAIVLATRTTNTTNTNVTTAGRSGVTSKPVWPSGGSGRLSRDWLTTWCAGRRPWNAALPRSSFDTGAPEALPSEGRTSGFEADEHDSQQEHLRTQRRSDHRDPVARRHGEHAPKQRHRHSSPITPKRMRQQVCCLSCHDLSFGAPHTQTTDTYGGYWRRHAPVGRRATGAYSFVASTCDPCQLRLTKSSTALLAARTSVVSYRPSDPQRWLRPPGRGHRPVDDG